jgi:FkbM family methyltransferase
MRTGGRLSRVAKDLLLNNAARLAPVARAIPGFGPYLYQADHPLLALLEAYEVDEVIDVGANAGQFAARLRLLGYRGRIVSFEPIRAVFERLSQRAARDPGWDAVHTAIGAAPGEAEINVLQDTALSSILDPSSELAEHDPATAIAYSEPVTVQPLDALVPADGRRRFLKVDAQGYEGRILDGAERLLNECLGAELELSLATPFYAGESPAADLRARLAAKGLTEVVLNPLSHTLRWGTLVQADAIFWRLSG